jgi:hypothetical protein
MKLTSAGASPPCPPLARLDAIAAGEVGEAAVIAHVSTCARCQEFIAAQRRGCEGFLRERPPELFLRKLTTRAARRSRPENLRTWIPLLAGGLAVVVLVLMALPSPTARFKGSPLRVVYRRGEATPQPVTSDSELLPGDALRFSYRVPRDGYLAVLDVDGAGNVTVFYPYGGGAAAKIASGWLPGSVVLDAAPGPDWLVAVYRDAPFDLAPLMAQLKSFSPESPDKLPSIRCSDCRVDAMRLNKRP